MVSLLVNRIAVKIVASDYISFLVYVTIFLKKNVEIEFPEK